MKNTDISITIPTIGLVATENHMAAVERFRPGIMSNSMFPPADPPDVALRVIKAGAQRWNTVTIQKINAFVFIDLYHFMPETMAALIRSIWS